jgi:quinol-cytochrome oxidoreductase complex cytochrome b subunit
VRNTSANPGRRFVEWFKSRFGLKVNVLRPVPEYSMNPLYWLGALTVIAFGLQVLTGLLMMIYYVPTVDQAYSSTLFIINSVPLGWLLETVHLYGAYAMILLAFLHLFRGYFASVQKKPREMMWVIGMLMGLTVLGFGLTGYLLPWTVVSKSATDVSIGMLGFLPGQIGSIITFLIAGSGSSAAELTRFFDLHIVVLPAGLLSLLALKLFLFEAHGAAEPVSGAKSSREIPWFPNVYLYFAMLGSLFVGVIFVAASLFPLSLPAEFSPQAASNYVPQPEWYFLWMYQVLKFASFEGSGIYAALGGVTAFAALLILLPFLDRGRTRNPWFRPIYTTLGLIMIAELVALTVWGYLTPGQIIPDVQALEVNGTLAVVIGVVSFVAIRRRSGRGLALPSRSTFVRAMSLPFTERTITAIFLLPLSVGSVSLSNLVTSATSQSLDLVALGANLSTLVLSFYVMVRILRRVSGRSVR